jgi:hypothetical protein
MASGASVESARLAAPDDHLVFFRHIGGVIEGQTDLVKRSVVALAESRELLAKINDSLAPPRKKDSAMAICGLLQSSAFGPEEINRMTTAYEEGLRVLGLSDRADPMTEILAKKIIEFTQTGECDAARICAGAVGSI